MHPITDPQLLESIQNIALLQGGNFDLLGETEVETHEKIHELRDGIVAMKDAMKDAWDSDVRCATATDHTFPREDGGDDITVRIYRPTDDENREVDNNNSNGKLPAILWMHGGGYVVGTASMEDPRLKQLCHDVRCIIVSVEYRLAPEHPYPAPLDDCYESYRWLVRTSTLQWLNIDVKRIALGGVSAGAGLAAGLALLIRDRSRKKEEEEEEGVDVVTSPPPPPCFQFLIYPMIDYRNVPTPVRDERDKNSPETVLWTRSCNLVGWKSYLGLLISSNDDNNDDNNDIPCYAAPARATSLEDLPPTYIMVGTTDLFRDETLHYASKLMKVGIPTELHVYPQGYHAFDVYAPNADISKRYELEKVEVLKKVLHPSPTTSSYSSSM